jgi:hypothetical protein
MSDEYTIVIEAHRCDENVLDGIEIGSLVDVVYTLPSGRDILLEATITKIEKE